jgi:hypothetical protein
MLDSGHVGRRPPATVAVLRELEIETLPVHTHRHVADPLPVSSQALSMRASGTVAGRATATSAVVRSARRRARSLGIPAMVAESRSGCAGYHPASLPPRPFPGPAPRVAEARRPRPTGAEARVPPTVPRHPGIGAREARGRCGCRGHPPAGVSQLASSRDTTLRRSTSAEWWAGRASGTIRPRVNKAQLTRLLHTSISTSAPVTRTG